MQFGLTSLLFLKKASAKNRVESNNNSSSESETTSPASRTRRQRFQEWLTPKPAEIQLFSGEKEIFRKGLILVTDTRLAYIDPLDRMLRTYMFEHMISVHKQFYRTTDFNRRLCKGLLIVSVLVLLIILIIDLLDSKSSGFFLVYLPLIASILIGIKVWNDMKPRYVIHWRMRDNSYGEIVQEPMLRERLKGDTQRETFMTDLANAMNEALSTMAWRPSQIHPTPNYPIQGHYQEGSFNNAGADDNPNSSRKQEDQPSRQLKLVTDSYQQ